MKNLVIHFTKCTDVGVVASARIAKFISEQLKIPLMDRPHAVPIKSYDILFVVNGVPLFCNFREELKDLMYLAKRIIYVQNDYSENVKPPSDAKKMLINEHRWIDYWTTIPKNVVNEIDHYINWNVLTFNPKLKIKEKTKKGLFYYGAFRHGRIDYFKKYFVDAPYKVYVSTTKSTSKKYAALDKRIKILEPFQSLKQIQSYQATIYIEDKASHEFYCSPANRFYECLSAGIAMFFDKSTVWTFEQAGIDVSKYVVDSKEDVEKMLERSDEIALEQRKLWFKDYITELKVELRKAFLKAVRKRVKTNLDLEPNMPGREVHKLMPSAKKFVLSGRNLIGFYLYMYERQKIWERRFVRKMPQPWTKDSILKHYKFTNVYRELDRNTQWLIKNVINAEDSEKEVFWKVIVFRYFNKPELFESMGGIPSYTKYRPEVFVKKVLKFKENGNRVFTDAYMINPPKKMSDRKKGIERFYCDQIEKFRNMLDELWEQYRRENDPVLFNDMLSNKLHCIAKFLAYEIYCDLCYTKWFKYGEDQFVNVGPGAKFGIRLIFPRSETRELKEYLYWLTKKASWFYEKLGLKFPYYDGKYLTLRCIEHSLCEFAKYWKMKMNVGKPRKNFEAKHGEEVVKITR